jgi:hypothetical protein
MKGICVVVCFLLIGFNSQAQLIYFKDKISSPYTLADKAKARHEKIVQNAENLVNLPIGSSGIADEDIANILWSVSQFMVKTGQSDKGIKRLVENIGSLSESTQRALLEVLYGLYPKEYYTEMVNLLPQCSHPKNFAIAAAYIYRAHPTDAGKRLIQQHAAGVRINNEGMQLMIYNLLKYIDSYQEKIELPEMDSLFARQQIHGFKMIYSFQNRNRDYPGIAIVQNADGSFMRDTLGKLRMFSQLARSASNLPWFISNGSTPQGLYSITGTAISRNAFIGPTPNLQMVMMNEVNPPTFTHYFPPVFNAPPERLYRSYFPGNWQQWPGLMEAYDAGKIGRSEIIAHGSTIDPEWYRSYPFYPLTPTMGCLCAKEAWNTRTGKIESSDQLDLVNAFIETAGRQGYMLVLNVQDTASAVDQLVIEKWVDQFEANRQTLAGDAAAR